MDDTGVPEFREVTYEGYGPGGTAVMVRCVTGNPASTLAELRSAFARHGGNLGAVGSVAYLFNEVGLLRFPPGEDRAAVTATALEAGAEDVVANGDSSLDVLTDPRDFAPVRAAMERAGLRAGQAGITLRSAVSVTLAERDAAVMRMLLEALENMAEVRGVYCNAELPASV